MSGVAEFFIGWWEAFKGWGKSLVLTVFDMLKDVFIWLIDALLSVVLLAIQGLGSLFDGLNVAQYITALPSSAQWVMAQTGIGTALGMIVTAIIIRLTLQLIPFTRLGS